MVVLRYFLIAGRAGLLLDLLGSPLAVSRIVFDPSEGNVPELATSEITRSILVQRRWAEDSDRTPAERTGAKRNAARLASAHELHGKGAIEVLDLTVTERTLFARLTSSGRLKELGLRFPLDPGEAASLVLAIERGLVLATDDTDALKALEAVQPDHPYERIRRLLRRAGEQRLVSRTEANAIHAEMRRLGFWDTGRVFP